MSDQRKPLTDDELRNCADGIEASPTPAYALGAAMVIRKAADEIADLKRDNAYLQDRAVETNATIVKLQDAQDDLKRRLAEALKHQQSPGTRARIEKAEDERDEARAKVESLGDQLATALAKLTELKAIDADREAAERRVGLDHLQAVKERDEARAEAAAYQERVRKLEAVAEIVRGHSCNNFPAELRDALAALEEKL